MSSVSRKKTAIKSGVNSPQVKYRNVLNTYSFSGLKKGEVNITFALLCMFRDKESTEIEFKADELRRLISYSNHHMTFERYAYENLKRLQKFVIERWTADDEENGIEGERASIVMFPYLALREKSGTICVRISSELSDLLHGIKNKFTLFTLAEMIALNGDHAKALYRLLRQFNSSGNMTIPIDRFRFLMGIPEYYRMCDIDHRVLQPAVAELTSPLPDGSGPLFPDLKYEKKKGPGRGRGGMVTDIVFTFTPVKSTKKVSRRKTSLQKADGSGREAVAQTTDFMSMSDLPQEPVLSEEEIHASEEKRAEWLGRIGELREIRELQERFAELGKLKEEFVYARGALIPEHAQQVEEAMMRIFSEA